ncbi:MAG: helix-turn-helix transcriptional regulator [Coriobacteriia bacterium]|nr:helix-turn-helix transcriptional regulator [Coriobacteriia bacterium]
MGIIPRITIRIDEDKASSEGITSFSLGFGLLQAWVFSTMYAAPTVFGVPSLVSSIGEGAVSLIYIISALTYSLCMIVIGTVEVKAYPLLRNNTACIIAGLMATLGSFALVASPYFESSAIQVVSGLLTGGGSAFLTMIWGCRLSRLEPRDIALNAALSISLGFIAYAIIAALPQPSSGCVASLLPLGSLIALSWHRAKHGIPANPFHLAKTQPVDRIKLLVRYGLPVFVFGIALTLLKQTTTLSLLLSPTPAEQVSIVAAACLAFALFVGMEAVTERMATPLRFFKPLIPLIAISAPLALISTGQPTPNLPGVLFMAVYMCFHMLLWDFLGELCQRYRCSPILIFGWGRALLTIAAVLIVLPAGTLNDGLATFFDHQMQVMILPIVIILAYVLLPSAGGAAALATTPVPAAAATDVESKAATDTAAAAQAQQVDAKAEDTIETAPPQPAPLSLSDRCEIVASRYQLSARESEVLTYLARGRNAAYIQGTLFISEGTTKTHMRHIYRKLDVHSQQELIQLVETAEA